MRKQDSQTQHSTVILLLIFLGIYIFCATFFQFRSNIPPGWDTAPIEYFTGGLLWMLALMALLIADTQWPSKGKALFWLLACMSLSALAIDEQFAFHERVELNGGQDDHFKLFLWLFTGVALYIISRMKDSSQSSTNALWGGYLFHALYLLVEIGDGDYFRLPFISMSSLKWLEEYFELFFLATYLIGFVLIYTQSRIPNKHLNAKN